MSIEISTVDFRPVQVSKKRSSDVTVLITDGILCKRKQRSMQAKLREFLSLTIWRNLTEYYFLEEDDTSCIVSPVPRGFDNEDKIFMSFIEGVESQVVLQSRSANFPKLEFQERREHLCILISNIGRICRLKSRELLMHGDFDVLQSSFIKNIDYRNYRFGRKF